MIELALAFNDQDGSYAEHAGVVLASVFRNTSSEINVHILHDETLSEESQEKLVKLAKSYRHTINFYPIILSDEMLGALANVRAIGRWTLASMYRLVLPALIQADKIIYLDCDVLVNMDIVELWEIDLGDYYLGAVQDQGIHGVAQTVIDCGLNPDNYFNSGVILFELNNIRQKVNWYEDVLNFLRNFPNTAMPDQDILNSVFGGNHLQLEGHFNSVNYFCAEHEFYNKIVHFAGEEKCWHDNCSGFALYQEYRNLTPWKEHEDKPKSAKKKSKSKTERKVRKSTLKKLRLVRKRKQKEKSKKRMTVTWTSLIKIKPVKRKKRNIIRIDKKH